MGTSHGCAAARRSVWWWEAFVGRDAEGDTVSRTRVRDFWCHVVQETVQIGLRRSSGFGRPRGYFVQCNQLDCQYVEENKPPCPLHIDMFADEIKAAEEARRDRNT
jgi:hypothetical protein